jgi:hypothetical protein
LLPHHPALRRAHPAPHRTLRSPPLDGSGHEERFATPPVGGPRQPADVRQFPAGARHELRSNMATAPGTWLAFLCQGNPVP